jgi:hypothetical protein
MKKSNLVTLADAAVSFANSKQGKKLKAMFDAERAESPARFAKKHDFEAMQSRMSADANFICAMHRFQALSGMRKDWENSGDMNEHFDQVFKEYQQYTLDAADYIRQYRDRQAVLDQAIIDEDNQ